MKDREIDELLGRAASALPAPDHASTHRIGDALVANLEPVRPLAPALALETGLLLICGVAAWVGANALGMYGIRRLSTAQTAMILTALAFLGWLSATLTVAAVTPGSRWRLSPSAMAVSAVLVLNAAFALLFHDYQMGRFAYEGWACLQAGLLCALPAAVLSALLLRRGFPVNATAAGAAGGTLAGLAGVMMLELHCPLLQAPHVLVWHTGVVPLSTLAAAFLARLAYRR
jgi:hypothetical protein